MRLGHWAESNLVVLYLPFFGAKICRACGLKWKMEFPLTLMVKVVEEIIDVGRSQSSFFST